MSTPRVNPALFGWHDNPREVDRIVASLPMPFFGAAATPLRDSGKGKVVLLYEYVRKVYGRDIILTQKRGVCVSKGWAGAVDDLKCVQIALNGARERFVNTTASEPIYAGARIEIGNGACGSQDGAVGAWAAKFVTQYGTLVRGTYGTVDLSREDDSIAVDWGAPGRGVPDNLESTLREHVVKTTSLVTTYEEARDALANGYPVTVCSDQGFQMTRDADGFARPEGSWPHCFLPGTLVSTKVPKPIETLVVGDLVLTHRGRYRPVTKVFTRMFDGDLLSFNITGLPDFRCTDEHPLLVYRPRKVHGARILPGADLNTLSGGRHAKHVESQEAYDETQPRWMPASEVRPGDYLLSATPRREDSAEAPEWAEATRAQNRPEPIAVTDDWAAVFGYYIANGNRRVDHGINFTAPLSKPEIPERIVATFRSVGIEPRVETEESRYRVVVDSVIVERSFVAWFGASSYAKRIPEFLLSGWNLDALFEGMSAGDGGRAADGLCYYDTISPCLALQVRELIISRGESPFIDATREDRPGAHENAKPGFRVRYRENAVHAHVRRWRNFLAMPVRGVTQIAYQGLVHNCEVEDDNSYHASGVISHNCMRFCAVDDAFHRPGLLCLNSWGSSWISGPKRHDQPDGSFWVDAETCDKMLRGRDSFSLSGFVGYPAQRLDHRMF